MSVIDEIIDDLQRQRDQVKAAYDKAETDRDVYGSAIRDRDQKREFFRQIKEVLDDLTRKQKDLEERLRFWEKMRDATGKVKKAIDRAIETIPTLTEPDVPIPDALPGRLWQGLSVGGGQFGLGPLPGLGSGFAGLLGSRGGRGARSSGMGGTVSGPMAGGNPGSGGGFDTGAPGGGFMPGVDSGGGYSGGGGGGTGTSPGPSRPTGQPGTPGPTTSPGTGTSGATREPGRSTQLRNIQGGVFSRDGRLYLAVEFWEGRPGGIMGFDTVTGRRVLFHPVDFNPLAKREFDSGGVLGVLTAVASVFTYATGGGAATLLMQGLYWREFISRVVRQDELEGLTLWDLDGAGVPGMDGGGQLHLVVSQGGFRLFFKHYRLNDR